MIVLERKDYYRKCQCCGRRDEGAEIRVAQKNGKATTITICEKRAMTLTVMLMERNWVKR